jgi:hypothetical protein
MSLSLDGQSTQNHSTTTPVTLSLTTTGGPGIIYVAIISNNSVGIPTSVTSPDIPDLAFRDQSTGGTNRTELWWGTYSGPLTATITIATGSAYTTAVAFGVSGAKTVSPFDTNASVPAKSGSSALASISTDNANDFIFANYIPSGDPESAGAGWTMIGDGHNFQLVEYQIVSATQTSLQATMNSGSNGGSGIMDAVKAALLPFLNTPQLLEI